MGFWRHKVPVPLLPVAVLSGVLLGRWNATDLPLGRTGVRSLNPNGNSLAGKSLRGMTLQEVSWRGKDLVRANLNPQLSIGGILLTMYDGRTRLAEQVVQEVRKHFSDLVYQTVVPRSVRLSEAPGYGIPIALYDPLSRGGIAYRDLALEFAARTGLLASTTEGVR